jgi:hypothetical protein
MDSEWVRVAVDQCTPIGFAVVILVPARQGAGCLEVTAGPAQSFYERVGFVVIGSARTQFAPAVRMRRKLDTAP